MTTEPDRSCHGPLPTDQDAQPSGSGSETASDSYSSVAPGARMSAVLNREDLLPDRAGRRASAARITRQREATFRNGPTPHSSEGPRRRAEIGNRRSAVAKVSARAGLRARALDLGLFLQARSGATRPTQATRVGLAGAVASVGAGAYREVPRRRPRPRVGCGRRGGWAASSPDARRTPR
jgi:hypothetical protein